MLNKLLNSASIQKFISFIKKYGLFIAPVLLFLLFMFLLVFSYMKSSKQNSSPLTAPSPVQSGNNPSNPSQEVSVSPTGKAEGIERPEKEELGWSAVDFSESDLNGLNADKATLPDGSIQYTYASETPSRQKEIIVKDGTIIFQRTPMFDTPINSMTNFYGNPEYTATGSKYWGPKAVTYLYLSQGFAFVANTDIQQVYEEMYFQPVNLDQFKSTYDTDLLGNLQQYQP